jgi:hypothetical protein
MRFGLRGERLESKDLVCLALYAVGLAMGIVVTVLNTIGTFPVSTLVICLGVAMFAIDVAGISSVSKK